MNTTEFLNKFSITLDRLNQINYENNLIDVMVNSLLTLKGRSGRLFIIGVGGSAANASHAVNDFRKLCNIEAYAPTDNVSELTARTNDEGWETVFEKWLKTSHLNEKDGLLVLSVGGGSETVSRNLVLATQYADRCNATILSIVGKEGGIVSQYSSVPVIIPNLFPDLVTPIAEAMQSVILHLLVSQPELQENPTKW